MGALHSVPLSTFRDPAGSLRFEGERVLRIVRPEHSEESQRFLRSKLAQRWMAKGQLIQTEILERTADGSVCLEHRKAFFPSYPWEWTPGQWISAAVLTLNLCEEALEADYILKDATPLNVLFIGPSPVFVDVLSFEQRDVKSPLWLAYGQFVRSFLLPLAAYKYLGWPLAATLHRRDGYEPADLYPYISLGRRWLGPLRAIMTLPYLMEGKKAEPRQFRQAPEVTRFLLRRTFRTLRKTLQALRPSKRPSRWSRYPQTASHYSGDDHEKKQAFVRSAISELQPANVLDLGANTGVYSRIAAEHARNVIAWDSDVEASEANWEEALRSGLPILPLTADPARPVPAVGWRNRESLSLLDRACGRFDCVMGLGLVHHLLVTDQIPLPAIAELLRDLTSRWLIVEWIPRTDVQFVELCRGRESLYSDLSEEWFEQVFSACFRPLRREKLSNGRTLWLGERG
jgi:SAM-dependent methyltransferase